MRYSLIVAVASRYDLVDLTRQALSKFANQVYLDVITSYQRNDPKNLDLNSRKFLELIKDIDILLASDDNFLLGTWLESAKSLAANQNERRQVIIHFQKLYFTFVIIS